MDALHVQMEIRIAHINARVGKDVMLIFFGPDLSEPLHVVTFDKTAT